MPRNLIIAAMLTLTGSGTAMAGAHEAAPQANSEAGKNKAAICLDCHSVDDFAALDSASIATALTAAVNGETAHPPLGSFSGQDIADIAAYLGKTAE